jgi:hypothetical protein
VAAEAPGRAALLIQTQQPVVQARGAGL